MHHRTAPSDATHHREVQHRSRGEVPLRRQQARAPSHRVGRRVAALQLHRTAALHASSVHPCVWATRRTRATQLRSRRSDCMRMGMHLRHLVVQTRMRQFAVRAARLLHLQLHRVRVRVRSDLGVTRRVAMCDRLVERVLERKLLLR